MDLIGIGGLILGFGLAAQFVKFSIKRRKEAEKWLIENSPIPIYFPVDENTVCYAPHINRPHDWFQVSLYDTNMDAPLVGMVCKFCGVHSDGIRQFTTRSINQLLEQIRADEEKQAFLDSLIRYRASEVERLSLSECATAPEREAFKRGYRAYSEIEERVRAKIKDRNFDKFKKNLIRLVPEKK